MVKQVKVCVWSDAASFHRITARCGMEGTLKTVRLQSPASGRGTSRQPRTGLWAAWVRLLSGEGVPLPPLWGWDGALPVLTWLAAVSWGRSCRPAQPEPPGCGGRSWWPVLGESSPRAVRRGGNRWLGTDLPRSLPAGFFPAVMV